MTPKAVIGLQFGDEGKGLTVDYLCRRAQQKNIPSLIIRYSGGPQAGHTVCLKDKRHVFASFGSGTLRGMPTYISAYCVIDPVAILNELNVLRLLGIDENYINLYIDYRCPIITPYDIQANQKSDENKAHGSCMVGIGATYKREEDLYSFTAQDIMFESILEIKLEIIKNYYHEKYNQKFLDIEEFVKSCKVLRNCPNIHFSYGIPKDFSESYYNYIYEGSQGLLLDQYIGFFPHVTRSFTGSKNIAEITKTKNIDFYLVTRAYQTRHGNGPMTNENIPNNIKKNPNETNVYNERQGDFRRSLLDMDLLKYAIDSDRIIRGSKMKSLVITCLDHVVNEHRCTLNGELVYHNSEEKFIKFIVGNISTKFDNIFISRSDSSDNIETF